MNTTPCSVTTSARPLHGTGTPSAWVTGWAHLISRNGQALDVACGAGRHAHWLATQGLTVTGVDRDGSALSAAQAAWPVQGAPARQLLQADLENQPWPLDGQQFDAVVVTNYLWRPLWPSLLAALAPGGVYIHETFAHGNASVGKPSRPDFLLQPGELLQICAGLRVVAFEDGFCQHPDRFVQRVVAVREAVGGHDAVSRYALTPAAQPARDSIE